MSKIQPYYREAGSGPGVVCIHSNASSSTQWRGLMDRLSATHHLLAPDSYGSGKSPDWHSDREIRLQDEVDFIEPVFELAGSPLTIIGHSYGAAVALMAALTHRDRVNALILYEPTLFSLVGEVSSEANGVNGIVNAVQASGAALETGDNDEAAKHFIDYWMGEGSWAATPLQRKPSITASIVNVRRWAYALMTEPTPVAAFAPLKIPVLYMLGEASPESAHAVARVLIPALQNVRVVSFPGLGHMAPISHPESINGEIARFLGKA
jgi:pimeloyl-ACP methyl ester carboxylesterase